MPMKQYMYLFCFNLAGSSAPHTVQSLHLTNTWGRKLEKIKMRELRQLSRTEKENIIIRRMIKEYTKHGMHNAIAYQQPINAQPVSKKAIALCASSPNFIVQYDAKIVQDIPLASVGKLLLFCSLPVPCIPAASSLTG